ncbi:hypothetical protein KL943_002122 [Ogataea angusta]|nr:hypothetical protein KL943_002122 [Ogataea angusta]
MKRSEQYRYFPGTRNWRSTQRFEDSWYYVFINDTDMHPMLSRRSGTKKDRRKHNQLTIGAVAYQMLRDSLQKFLSLPHC